MVDSGESKAEEVTFHSFACDDEEYEESDLHGSNGPESEGDQLNCDRSDCNKPVPDRSAAAEEIPTPTKIGHANGENEQREDLDRSLEEANTVEA